MTGRVSRDALPADDGPGGAAESSTPARRGALSAEALTQTLRLVVREKDARITDMAGPLYDPAGTHLADENARLRERILTLNSNLLQAQTEPTAFRDLSTPRGRMQSANANAMSRGSSSRHRQWRAAGSALGTAMKMPFLDRLSLGQISPAWRNRWAPLKSNRSAKSRRPRISSAEPKGPRPSRPGRGQLVA
jgi:hypothetical protein